MLAPDAAIDVLVAFSRRVSDAPVPDEILPALVDACHDHVGADAVVVFQIRDGGGVRLAASHGLDAPTRDRCERLDVLSADLGSDVAPDGWAESPTLLLVSAGGLFGALVLLFREPVPGPWRMSLASGLADLAAIALDKAFHTAELRQTIAELEASREALARAEQLKALGQMAAVVAHEVRNPLASFSGTLQVLRGRFAEATMERSVIDKLLVRLGDLNLLLGDLLSFARPQEPRRTPLSLRALLNDVVSAFRGDEAHDDVAVTVEGDDVHVPADAGMLRAVFQNLLINAAQAMDGSGRVRVSVARVDGTVHVDVADDGPGIPDDVRERVFEPFFTTKTRGTGLGLPMSQRVIDGHGGRLEVTCPPEGGTVFRVVLPEG